MSRKSDIAYKICAGDFLSLQEFAVAVKARMINSTAKTDKELAQSYLWWTGQYYEDKERKTHGYLCGMQPLKKRIEQEDSKDQAVFCMWGLHLDEIVPTKLTSENLKFLRHCFGKDKVKEITGR